VVVFIAKIFVAEASFFSMNVFFLLGRGIARL